MATSRPPRPVTVLDLERLRAEGRPIVAVTAYTAPEGRLCDRAGVDLVLVGDSLGRAVLGFPNELSVTMEDMERHTAAVARGVRRALLVADLPFLAYQADAAEATRNAGRLVRAGASAVKLEGGLPALPAVERILAAGIPVVGHLGFTPQAVHRLGGPRVQGRGPDGAAELRAAAGGLAAAGVSAIVLEMVPAGLAAEVTAALPVPTIGIGAGVGCGGQVLVLYDLIGLSARVPRLARTYGDAAAVIGGAVAAYARDVRAGAFPAAEHTHDGERWGGPAGPGDGAGGRVQP